MSEVPEDGIARRMGMIVGFDIEVRTLRGKLKLGQDEPVRDALAVADRLAASADAGERASSAMVRAHNRARAELGSAGGLTPIELPGPPLL